MRCFSRVLAGCLLLTLLMFSAVRLVRAERSRDRAREQLAVLRTAEQTLAEENAALRRRKTQGRENMLQLMARDRLGLVEPDEEIYVFQSIIK